jgi:nucleoid-associated protein YgaU
MAAPASFQKARLRIEGGGEIACLFNPTEYSVTKSNGWDAKATPGASAGKPQFTGGQPKEMTLQLLFDATLLKPPVSVKDITKQLMDMMEATKGSGAGTGGKKNTKRPPTLTFVWGTFISFEAVAKTLTIKYLLFEPNGEPIRADVTLALMQADAGAMKGQNPTTRADGSLGTHVVRDGDSLASIAQAAYGDATQWRPIAQANGVDDPLRLRQGQALAIPRLEA